jgi:hypothetical protein
MMQDFTSENRVLVIPGSYFHKAYRNIVEASRLARGCHDFD